MRRFRFVFLAVGIVLIADSTNYSFWSWESWLLVILGGAAIGVWDAVMASPTTATNAC